MMDVAPSVVAPQEVRATALPNAKDMSHHINRLTRNRQINSLKEMYKYALTPGMVSMAGGMPSPAIFPFESLSAETLPYNHLPLDPPRVPGKPKKTWKEWLFGGNNDHFSIPKYAPNPTDPMAIQLATSLQYQTATGPPAFGVWLRKYVETVYAPGYADWDVLLDVGSTDGFGKVFNMLLEFGDSVLVEEWTYPGAMGAYMPFEVEVVSLKMDGQGVLPEYMESVLANWDEEKEGHPRPRVFYTVPTGQNPTGATMLAERRKQIYDICAKYDVIIVEDEPYYTLYVGDWIPQGKAATPLAQRLIDAEKKEGKEGNEAFIKSLPPSFLRFDTDGRVIRLDTFSKTSCPGSRLGWITSSPLFIERLTRISEASTQAPSGFATALTITLLNTWGFDGYIRWLRGIKAMYKMRRDWMCDILAEKFHLEFDDSVASNGLVRDIAGLGRGITAYARPEHGSPEAKWDEKRGVMSSGRGPALLSFIPPTAGMFIFLAIHMDQHPDYARLGGNADAVAKLMEKLWRELAEHLVLFAPGVGFDAHGVHSIGGDGTGYFRLSYSITPYDQLRQAMDTFAKVLTKFFKA